MNFGETQYEDFSKHLDFDGDYAAIEIKDDAKKKGSLNDVSGDDEQQNHT